MAARAYQRDGKLSGLATGLKDLDGKMGGLQKSDLIIVAGRPGMGKTALATNIAYNVARAWRGEVQRRRPHRYRQRRHRRLLLARNVGRAARHPHHRRAERHPLEHDPARRASPQADSSRSRTWPSSCSTCRSIIDETGGLTIAQLAARARRLKRQRGLDLLVIDYIQLLPGSTRRASGKPRAGDHRDHHQPQGAGQGAQRPDHGAVAAVAPGREPRRQAAAALRPA